MAVFKEGNEFFPLVEDRDTILELGKVDIFLTLNTLRLAHDKAEHALAQYHAMTPLRAVVQAVRTKTEVVYMRRKAVKVLENIYLLNQ
jgi:hypothetical protein